jgi:hypothetical protein
VTLASFRARRVAAESLGSAHADAANAVLAERSALAMDADALYDLCVQWYVIAAACFKATTPEGRLIRTVPTNYDVKTAKQPELNLLPASPADAATRAA